MSKENKDLIHRWFEEVWNRKNADAIDEMLTDETIHHGLGNIEDISILGIDDFKRFHQSFLESFPDLKVEIKDCITEADKISIRCEVTGTHSGEGQSKVKFTGAGICTVKDGKFVEVWNEFDFMKMYSQLGMLTLNLK